MKSIAGEEDDCLLANIKKRLPELESLLERVSSHWFYEDPIYRFYHRSFKVYGLQAETRAIVEALQSLAPEAGGLCDDFMEIVREGAGEKRFVPEHNADWPRHTRVFVEAFLHARFFLEMAVKYGRELQRAPDRMPSGWAALLCLYNLR